MSSTSTSLWSPPYYLSPTSSFDSQVSSNNGMALPAPLLSSSPVNSRRRRAQSMMNNSLDLDGPSVTSGVDSDADSGLSRSGSSSQFMVSPPSDSSYYNNSLNHASSLNQPCSVGGDNLPAKSSHFLSVIQFLQYRTELLVSGQQATAWNHYTIVSQLRKLENLNLIDRSLIKQDNPPIEILTLVQKLIKYNLAIEVIDNEDDTLRQEQLAKLIKLRGDEVLAISGSIQEITEQRQAIYEERCRIRAAMKEIGVEIAIRTRGSRTIIANSLNDVNKTGNKSQDVPANSKPLIFL